MEFSNNELLTIKRALIIYEKYLPRGLRNKGFFIDSFTFKEDIKNIINIMKKLEGS